jgi:transcriptional regulator with XRE-family HTH domain
VKTEEIHVALFNKAGEANYEALVAENRFISDIQIAIESALTARDVSQSDLARMLDVSAARVSQMLSGNGANLTARTVARIAHVLGFRARLGFSEDFSDGWWREEFDHAEPIGQFVNWVRVACETLEESGVKPGAVSNDGWQGTVKNPSSASEDHPPAMVAA